MTDNMETLSEKVSPIKSDQEQVSPSSKRSSPMADENYGTNNDQNSDYGLVLTMPKISQNTLRVPKPFSIESIIGTPDKRKNVSTKSTEEFRPQECLEDPEIVRIRELMKMQQYLNPLNCQQFFQHQNVTPGNFPLNLYTNTWFNPLHSIFNLHHPAGFDNTMRKPIAEEVVEDEHFNEECHIKNDEDVAEPPRRTDVPYEDNIKERLGNDGYGMVIDNDERDDVSICGSDRDSDSGSEVSLSCCSTSEAQDLTSGKVVQGDYNFF